MKTSPYLLIDKVFHYYQKQINFLEEYYSKEIGYKISIQLDWSSGTSRFSPNSRKIFISANNLYHILNETPKLFYSMFYTLMLHEIGHALYTDRLPFTEITNVIEDNRIEHQIKKWNVRVRFDVLRYMFQDLSFMRGGKIESKTDLALAMLRTIDNRMVVAQIGNTPKRKDIVERILKLNNIYMNKDYRLFKEPQKTDELVSISETISKLFDQLIEDWNSDNQQGESDQEEKDTEDKDSDGEKSEQKSEEKSEENEGDSDEDNEDNSDEDSEDSEDSSDEDSEDGEEKESDETEQDSSGEDASEDQDGEEETEKESQAKEERLDQKDLSLQEVEEELARMQQLGAGMEQDLDNGIGVLVNDKPDKSNYNQFKISAFTTARRKGIKGTEDHARYTGNAKQLSLKKYARRDYVQNERMFDKRSDDGRGGKNAQVLFYLDISSSMRGRKLDISINYLKSFYDQMNKYLDIRFMAFGKNTYELTRDELDFNFLRYKLEDYTDPTPIKTKPHEEIIFITDGQFGRKLPPEYMRKAHFVLIDVDYRVKALYFSGMKNVYEVSTMNFYDGLEKATQHIRDLLKEGR